MCNFRHYLTEFLIDVCPGSRVMSDTLSVMDTLKSSEGEYIYNLHKVIYLGKIFVLLFIFKSFAMLPSHGSHYRCICFCFVSELECFHIYINHTASNTAV